MVSQRSSNPAFTEAVYRRYAAQGGVMAPPMTIEGVVNKTLILLLLAVVSASTWSMLLPATHHVAFGDAGLSDSPNAGVLLAIGGAIGGFIVSLVTIFKPNTSPFTAPLYAILEGLFLGGLSAGFEASYPGIPVKAVGLTFGTLLAMLFAYRSGLITVTDKFRAGVISATGGVCLFMLGSFLLQFFGVFGPADMLWSSATPLSIGVCIAILVLASLNLLLDFDMIEKGVAAKMPKFMEWYCGFALMVTLVWLYYRFMRLLSQLARR